MNGGFEKDGYKKIRKKGCMNGGIEIEQQKMGEDTNGVIELLQEKREKNRGDDMNDGIELW